MLGAKKTKKRHFRYLKRCALADHRRTLKCMIKYWSGHPTAHNPDCYRSPMQVGTAWLQHSLMPRAVTRVWVIAQRETGQSRADPEMGSTTSPPADRSQSLCFLPAQIITSIASPRRERHGVNVTQSAATREGRCLPPTSPSGRTETLHCPCRLAAGCWHDRPCWKSRESSAAWGHPWVAVSLCGSACPPCPHGSQATRGHWSLTEALKRAEPPRRTGGLLSDGTAFSTIRSADKIPEQRIATRLYSLPRVSTVHYEVWNKTGVHKHLTMNRFMRRELAPVEGDFLL